MASPTLNTTADVRGLAALYGRILAARVRSDWQYRTSFLALVVSQALVIALELLTVLLLLRLVPDFGGWSTVEVVFLYGLATVPFAISDVFVSAVDRVSNHVREGTFDRILLRPIPPLIQISALEFELRRAGKLIPSAAALGWAVWRVDVAWGPAEVALLVLALASGTVIYSALWILAASVSFWTVNSREAMNAVTFGGQFANQYPIHVYRGWIRVLLGWGIPLAFVAYVPAVRLLDPANPLGLPRWLVFAAPAVAAASLAVALGVWRTGIAHYRSTGS
ncbi:MAG: ABC-2 family transporter protein [Actinomycetota bacterium]